MFVCVLSLSYYILFPCSLSFSLLIFVADKYRASVAAQDITIAKPLSNALLSLCHSKCLCIYG